MDEFTVKIKKLRGGAQIPAYASESAAALDLRAATDAPLKLAPHARVLVPTGIAIEPSQKDTVALVFARSGLSGKHGISLANGVGVIDSDYRGEILVSMINNSDTEYEIAPGERVAQLAFMPVLRPVLTESDTLGETERGAGGFGSTGKK